MVWLTRLPFTPAPSSLINAARASSFAIQRFSSCAAIVAIVGTLSVSTWAETCPVYQPPPFGGQILPIAYINRGTLPIDVRLYHPGSPEQPFSITTVRPGQNIYLSDAGFGVGDDWGIAAGTTCALPVSAAAIYYPGQTWQATGYDNRGLAVDPSQSLTISPTLNSAGATVTLNGSDSDNPTLPFTFDWGDGTFSVGSFPKIKTYSRNGIFAMTVYAQYSGPKYALTGNHSNGYASATVTIVGVQPSTTSVTISSNPAGRIVLVDGISVTTPKDFNWLVASSHTVDVPSPQGSGSTRYVFDRWSQGGARSQTIVAPSVAATYAAVLSPQHLLTAQANPTPGGTITASPSSPDGFYADTTQVRLTASASSSYAFAGFSGDLSGVTNPQTVVMSAPRSVTANFTTLTVFPTSYQFTYQIGGALPSSQTVAVSGTLAPLSFTAVSDSKWLKLDLSSGTTPASLHLTIDPSGLNAGQYTGKVAINAPSVSNGNQQVTVNLTVSGSLLLAPPTVSWTYQSGGSPPSQTVAVSSQGAPLSFVATAQSTTSAGANWLSVTPASGTTPANLTVSLANTDTLAPGTYSGSVTVSLPDKAGTQIVNVTLTIGAAFDVLAPALQFSVSNGASSNQSLLVTNLSPLALDVTATSRNGYVSITPPTITISAVAGKRQSQFVASVKPSSLPGGLLQYADSIILTAGGQSQVFPLSISVLPDDSPQPRLSSTAVTLFTLPGLNNHDQTDIQLLNAGTGPLDFYVSYPAPWITVTPAAPVCLVPSSCQDVRLPAGQIQSLTIVTNDSVVTQSKVPPAKDQKLVVFSTALTVRHGLEADVVNVYLNVPWDNQPNLPPRTSAAGVLVGLPDQPTQTVTLRSFNTTPASFTITAPAWLPVTSSSTSIPKGNPGLLDLTIGPPSRVPTQEEIQAGPKIELTFGDIIVNNAPYVLQIQTVYAGTSQTTQSSQSLSSIHPLAATCTPSQLSAVFASPANQFQVTAGLPVSLVARISDNCGNVPASAAALVTFSSGESPLSLTQWPDGLWRGTWQPQAPQPGPVTLVLSAASETISATTQTLLSGTVTGNALVPVVLSKSVVNAASQEGQNDTISPGEIVTIYGSNLASQTLAAAGSPVASLGSVTVTASGVTLPLFSVSSGQVNAIFPYGFPVGQTVLLVLTRDGVPSVPLPLKVVPARPGIFTQSADGKGAGAIVDTGTADHPAAYIVDAAHPAHSGDNISIYCTGLGPVDTGQGAPKVGSLPRVTGQLSAIIGTTSAEVFYAGLAPGFSGLYQVNARVPASAPRGIAAVQLSVNNVPSNGVTLAIQ